MGCWSSGVKSKGPCGPLDQSLSTVSFVRRAIWNVFKEEIEEDKFPSSVAIKVGKTINPLLDDVSFHFSQVYLESIRIDTQKEDLRLAELSVSVVSITRGVAVLPLIGEIDSQRAQLLMETSLTQSTELDLG